MRLLVCGGRDYSNRERLFRALDAVQKRRAVMELIHGAATGADSLAGEWAVSRGIPVTAVPADWATHGRAAGPIRNEAMLAMHPDGLVAFRGGIGTAHMVRIAEKARVTVWRVDW